MLKQVYYRFAVMFVALLVVAGCASHVEPPAPQTPAQAVQRLAYEFKAVVDTLVAANERGEFTPETAARLDSYINQVYSALKLAATAVDLGDIKEAEAQMKIARAALVHLRAATTKGGTKL